jgi:energy-coupling factor transporter ATP-binding protein EcfA2
LTALSRKCVRPLGVLIQSPSAGGKSTLVEAVAALVPPEDLVSLSAITSQALYYLGGTGLRHKVLFVAEERGSARASYALKLLVSEGRLAIASTGKDPSGQLRTRTYETVGPMSLMMTTTATTLDPELENRLVVLGVDENAAQTQAIIKAQLEAASLAGLHARTKANDVRARHHDIQRLLEPMTVVIPDVTLSFPSSTTRHRRDHAKLLSMISVVTLLHQHQRERRGELVEGVTHTYLEATPNDIEVASRLCANVLARDAETLAPQVRRLLDVVRSYASHRAQEEDCEASEIDVTRRQLRERLGWSDTQVRAATDRLVALEYLVVSTGGRGRCRTYRLVPDFAPTNLASVRDRDQPTSQATSSGEVRQFVEFAPLADLSERGTPYTEVSYPDTASNTSQGVDR